MSEVRMTASEARAAARADWDKIDATTEVDMRRHALEDGEDLADDQPFVMRGARRTRSIDEISDEGADLTAEARSPPGLEQLNDLLDEQVLLRAARVRQARS